GPVLAGLARRAGVVVVARAAVRLVRVRAHARRRVAGAGDVALVERRAGDGGGRAPAGAVLAGLARRAGVVVVARRAIGLGRVGAHAGARVAGPDVVALVRSRADDGVGARARPALAGVGLRAGVPVVAGRVVGLGWVGAHARARVAGPYVVALVGGGADDGVGARTRAALAGVGLRAGIPVVAGRAVGLDGVVAGAVGIAGGGLVALVGRRADAVVDEQHRALGLVGRRVDLGGVEL